MLRSVLAILLSMHFFLGSTLLPKGDFALIADLPTMYHQYTIIDKPEDIGLVDFIVDYLLNGEAFNGHETYRGRPIPYNTVQFQHQANALSFVVVQWAMPMIKPQTVYKKYYHENERLFYHDYRQDIFRPPLV